MARSRFPRFSVWIAMVVLLGEGCASEANVLDSQGAPLSELSSDERELLCEAYEADPDERMQRAHCLALVAAGEPDAEHCESWFDHCLQLPLEKRCQGDPLS